MKTKKMILICGLSLISISCLGQSNLVKGSKYIGAKFGGGEHSLGKYGSFELGWCWKEKFYLRSTMSYEYASISSTKLNVGRINVDPIINIFDIEQRLYVNGVVGGFFGFENSKSTRNPISTNKFVFGGNAGLELDFYLNERFSIKAEFLQYYMQNSQISPWFYTGTMGLSYIIN